MDGRSRPRLDRVHAAHGFCSSGFRCSVYQFGLQRQQNLEHHQQPVGRRCIYGCELKQGNGVPDALALRNHGPRVPATVSQLLSPSASLRPPPEFGMVLHLHFDIATLARLCAEDRMVPRRPRLGCPAGQPAPTSTVLLDFSGNREEMRLAWKPGLNWGQASAWPATI